MKIYYKNLTNEFAGSGCIEKKFINGTWKQELSDKKYSFIEVDEEDWMNFLETAKNKVIKVINGKLITEDKIPSLEEVKSQCLSLRNSYLSETSKEWGDDWENCPKEILNKRILARTQKNEISSIENKGDLENYLNNNNF